MIPLPKAPLAYDSKDEQDTRTKIERAITDLERPAANYRVDTILAPLREITAASTTDDVRDVVRTLISDLKKKGMLG